MSGEYVIAHLSDVHVGEKGFRKDKVQACIREVNELSPNLVVVTGDLTSDGLVEEFRGAREFIDELEAKTVVVMGNHDAKNLGYLHFEEIFGGRMATYEDDRIYLVGVDSTQPDVDEGHIGREFRRSLHDLILDAPRNKVKVFVLHHHLVPVPMAGRERDILVDAGDILMMLIKDGVKVVLCGHRHVSWVWSIEGMVIIHAGTVGSRRVRGMIGQNYSILRMADGKMSIGLKRIGEPEETLRALEID
ncbi:MAG: metallophosphoesterase family protein [Candidatus Geothermarchaeales archaeon]